MEQSPADAVLFEVWAREVEMRVLTGCVVLALLIGGSPAADAKGCVKGAVIGGTAGHFAGHHGLLGAAAGCVMGRHEPNKRDRIYPETDGRGRYFRRDSRDRI
jgi:hypothetical protein